jgi:RNA polymerase sporulation-specific sigma factor
MMISKIEICGVDFSSLPVLKEKETSDLLYRIQNGDCECRETFIKENLRLILIVITHFNNPEEKTDDLFQVGYIGLMKSIDNFDLSLNVRFSTFAIPMIFREIRRYLKDAKSIRVSESLRDIAYRTIKVRNQLVTKNIKEPTITQIAKELNLQKEEVVFALDSVQEPLSLFEPILHVNA